MGAEKPPNGQRTTRVEDWEYGHRTGVQSPAAPLFGTRKRLRVPLCFQRFSPISHAYVDDVNHVVLRKMLPKCCHGRTPSGNEKTPRTPFRGVRGLSNPHMRSGCLHAQRVVGDAEAASCGCTGSCACCSWPFRHPPLAPCGASKIAVITVRARPCGRTLSGRPRSRTGTRGLGSPARTMPRQQPRARRGASVFRTPGGPQRRPPRHGRPGGSGGASSARPRTRGSHTPGPS